MFLSDLKSYSTSLFQFYFIFKMVKNTQQRIKQLNTTINSVNSAGSCGGVSGFATTGRVLSQTQEDCESMFLTFITLMHSLF